MTHDPEQRAEPSRTGVEGTGRSKHALQHGRPVSVPDEELDGRGRVVRWKGFTLTRFQIEAISAIRDGKNVLVSAPTGAGKTLVAEYAIADSVARGKRCIYTAPIKALSNQKYRDFRDDPLVDVGLMTGDATIQPGAQVLIMTTEILRNAIFENPELLADVEYVVFDEVHYMDDRERGTVWEESLIFLPQSIRLVCLSATISNVEEMGNWLEEVRDAGLALVREERRPVPLSHWCWTERNGAFEPSQLDRIRKKAANEPVPRRPRRPRRGRGRGGRGGRTFDPPPDPAALFDELTERKMLPALVFSFSRRDCERLARVCEGRPLLTEAEAKRAEDLQLELCDIFLLNRRVMRGEILTMARAGVGYHHAGMLPVFKEIVERMFTAGLLKFLFTTETFALGINMPARTAVFSGLKKFDGIDFDYLRTRDYMQMAGRAGRQGIDDKGFVYCVLGNKDLQEAPLARLFAGKPEPVRSRFRLSYSSLLHLVEHMGRDLVPEAWERSFASFQAREKSQKARERQRHEQRRAVERHLSLLDKFGYLDGDSLTPRGRMARILNGYELQMTELLFRGCLEDLPPRALAIVAVAMIHEERRRHGRPYVPSRLFGNVRSNVTRVVGELASAEAGLGIEPGLKLPDWGLTPSLMAWYDGADIDAALEPSEATAGDFCRVLRMSIQLMRNVRRAIDKEWDLWDRLGDAMDAINRDEVDARRQLELG
ncbi:MAG: DEAD/DEAH box helicase [Planctomycetota bacterium]|nr:DEAD/DEAH box helicase [Planctomycetota bacterium]